MQELVKLLKDSLPEIIGGLVVAAVLSIVGVIYAGFGLLGVLVTVITVLLLSILLSWLISRQKASSSKRKVLVTPSVSAHPESELIGKFRLRRHQIIANVHDKYSLELDSQLRTALTELNAQRREQGLKEYFPSTRFRLIRPPEFTSSFR